MVNMLLIWLLRVVRPRSYETILTLGKICISGKQSKREIKWLRLGKGQRC